MSSNHQTNHLNQLKVGSRSLLLVLDSNASHQDQVLSFLKQQKIINPNQPQTDLNWFNQEEESLKIKQVRTVIEQTSYGSYSGKQRVFVLLHADNSSLPAQNALLKIIEEPPSNTLMILTANQPQQLLPTILSRCIHCNLQQQLIQEPSQEILSIAQKILNPDFDHNQAIELAQDYKKREQALALSQDLIVVLHQKLDNKKLSHQQKSKITQTLQLLLKSYHDLQQNLNPQLTLEHYFFAIIKL